VLEDLNIVGDFEDRTRKTRHGVTVLSNAGLTDEVIAARAVASRRAWFELIPGKVAEVTYRREKVFRYQPLVQNRGPSTAERVIVELVRSDDREQVFVSEPFDRMEPHAEREVAVRLPSPQPTLTCRLSWRDAVRRAAASGHKANEVPRFPNTHGGRHDSKRPPGYAR
jgi:hypothetical protein